MSDLFGNTLSTLPKWLSPSEFSLESERASESIGRNFSSSFNAAANRTQQQNQFNAELPIKLQEAETNKLKAQSALQGQALDNTLKANHLKLFQEDQASFGQWMNDNPTVGSRLNAEPPKLFTPDGGAMFANTRAADSATTLGMTLKADQADFAKRISMIPADDRSEIMGMSNDPNTGLPTKMKWQALGMVEQRMGAEKQREATDKVMEPARIRAESAENITNIKGKFSMDELNAKLQASANKPVKAFQSPSSKAAFQAGLDVIKKDDALDTTAKFNKIDELEKRFKVNNPENQTVKPANATDPSARARTVIQNGKRFNLNPDGSYQYLGPAE